MKKIHSLHFPQYLLKDTYYKGEKKHDFKDFKIVYPTKKNSIFPTKRSKPITLPIIYLSIFDLQFTSGTKLTEESISTLGRRTSQFPSHAKLPSI